MIADFGGSKPVFIWPNECVTEENEAWATPADILNSQSPLIKAILSSGVDDLEIGNMLQVKSKGSVGVLHISEV